MTIIFTREHFPQSRAFHGLQYAIKSARQWSPNSRVVLIGDKHQPKDLCEFAPMEDYSLNKNELIKIYKNASDGPSWWLYCGIAEWMVIYEWMEVNHVHQACVLDTDVLTFADMDVEAKNWLTGMPWFDWTQSCPMGTCQAPIWVTLEAVRYFSQFLFDLYQRKFPEADKILRGPCDCMALWSAYYDLCDFKPRRGDTSIIVNGSTFDHNLCMDYHGYEHDGTSKVVRFRKGQPYIRKGDEEVRFNILHCRGHWKDRMGELWQLSEESRTGIRP